MSLLAGCALMALFVACSGDTQTAPRGIEPRAKVARTQVKPKADNIYLADGELRASEHKVQWLEIPAGFERATSLSRRTTYEGRAPLKEVLRFYDKRLFTGKIEVNSHSASYHGAVPRGGVRGAHLDVFVAKLPYSDLVAVTVYEVEFPGHKPLSVSDAKSALAHERARAE